MTNVPIKRSCGDVASLNEMYITGRFSSSASFRRTEPESETNAMHGHCVLVSACASDTCSSFESTLQFNPCCISRGPRYKSETGHKITVPLSTINVVPAVVPRSVRPFDVEGLEDRNLRNEFRNALKNCGFVTTSLNTISMTVVQFNEP